MLLWMMTALAAPLPLGPGHGPPPGPPGPPPPEAWVHRAEEVGVAPATVDRMRALVEAGRPALEAAQDEVREGHEALRDEMLATAHPDRAAVLAASAGLADAEARMRELHLTLELDLRALLTEEEFERVRPPPPPGAPRR